MEKQLQIVEMAKDICRYQPCCNDVCKPISACDALRYAERGLRRGMLKSCGVRIVYGGNRVHSVVALEDVKTHAMDFLMTIRTIKIIAVMARGDQTMSKEKQIAEIARDFNNGMCSDRDHVESCAECVGASEYCVLYEIATRIYNAGYRKQSEDERRCGMSRQHHYVKILPKFFMDVDSGKKTFEIRFNDRGYKVGDILHLQEFCGGEYTGREIEREICYLIDSPEYCKEGFVVLGLKGGAE